MPRRSRLSLLVALAVVLPSTHAAASRTPDAMHGRALFIGAHPFERGGPPCGACHAVGGQSTPLDTAFDAAMGPELSASFEGMAPEALDGLLQDLPFPTMAPVYAGRALTPEERVDLAAFLLEASGKPVPSAARFAVCAALVASACLAFLALSGRRARRGSIRAELLARARAARPSPHGDLR